MQEPVPAGTSLGALVRALDEADPAELVEVCADWLRDAVGARECALLLADYGETVLEAVPGAAGDPPRGAVAGRYDVEGSVAGAAYRERRRMQSGADGTAGGRDGTAVAYVPVSMRSDRIGVLAVALPAGGIDRHVGAVLDEVAQVLAYVLTGARRYTDRYETLRRRRDFELAAEIQWELLPALAYELPWLSIAGALEPTYDIGGDTFDYAISARSLTVAVTDAVGHGLRAAMLGSLAVTAMRNARRCGEPISGQARAANHHLAEQFPGPSWVTGLIIEVDAASGAGELINAGHPPPVLLRDGHAEPLSPEPDPPLGLLPPTEYRLHRLTLRPGDRLLFLTDGIIEAHRRGGPFFGLDSVVRLLVEQAHLAPVELVRLLTRAVLDHVGGNLSDDATAVCLDWRRG